MSTGLETLPSVILMKISRVNPCLADCTGLFTFKGIHIFGSAGASTIQHHLKTGAKLGSSDSGHLHSVLLGRAASQRISPLQRAAQQAVQHHPKTYLEKYYYLVWLVIPKKGEEIDTANLLPSVRAWRCILFTSLDFPEFHFINWLAKHFKRKTNTSFILLWLHSRCSYFIAKYLICAYVCVWIITYCRILASHFALFNLVCWCWPENL